MPVNLEFITNLRSLLTECGLNVSKIEMTSENYTDGGKLIHEKLPTITTELCEIGAHDHICYFTIIMSSKLLTNALFDKIAQHPDTHIYGLNSFVKDYYPKKDFVRSDFVKEVNSENFVQIQFNFDIIRLSPNDVFRKYSEVRYIFSSTNTNVVDQTKQIRTN